EPIGLEFRERIRQIDRVHRRQAPVDLDEDIDALADRIAHRARHFRGTPDMILQHIGAPGARNGIELQGGEAALEDAFRATRVILRLAHLVAPTVRVDANTRTAGAAEEIVDRLLRRLAGDVPQRLFDARGGAIKLQRAAALRIIVERDLKDVADVERIATDEIASQLFDL